MQELEGLTGDELFPILGQLQFQALQQDKTIRVLRARITELEGKLERVNGKKKEAVPS